MKSSAPSRCWPRGDVTGYDDQARTNTGIDAVTHKFAIWTLDSEQLLYEGRTYQGPKVVLYHIYPHAADIVMQPCWSHAFRQMSRLSER